LSPFFPTLGNIFIESIASVSSPFIDSTLIHAHVCLLEKWRKFLQVKSANPKQFPSVLQSIPPPNESSKRSVPPTSTCTETEITQSEAVDMTSQKKKSIWIHYTTIMKLNTQKSKEISHRY
jgi:hypothetical protein